MGGAEPLEVVATILATLVGMHQDASVGFAAPDGHEEGIQRQFAAQRRLHGPAHHLAGVQVQHHGKVQPALPCPDVGDVGDPDLVGRVDGESLLQAIGREEGWAAGKRPRLPVAADGPDLVAPHEPLDTMQAAGLAHFPQVAEHPASPVNLMTARMGVPDELQQSGILDVAIRYRGMKPGIKPGPGNPQDTAHQRDGIVMPVLIHEAVLHSVRIPMKPAIDSETKPATCSDFIPASIPI